ncbi:hypothetical protein FPRO06_02078 [Fusarium proliferatum]|uniref:Uncharacterized protein n=1 Tax=Fusarium proliferatum (strain ET1) TaxID=1227346 RepID=A0A1L7VIK4_FUSPR|nr:uncharacterized protein FPRO_05321 [Fusarium proliferatum ET1]KAG4268024.1 hypothetical protein FPRO04_04440 [Fusarium proliferatum]KAG4290192.1 hypothetical protein FPRO06_02078 [Fusarium proliferatum]CZR40421.1 uncharacterized protein FPRO_05321 [Fusarium proliferatum ET1]
MALLIGKGDTIYVRDVELDNEPIVVKWQQWGARSERYIPAQYRNITGKIFIQVSKADEFRLKHDRSKDSYTVRINQDFLYGQNKEQTKRFLVLHDKEHKPYQFRFVESAMVAAGNEAAKVAHSLGFDGGLEILELLKRFLGDYLKEF